MSSPSVKDELIGACTGSPTSPKRGYDQWKHDEIEALRAAIHKVAKRHLAEVYDELGSTKRTKKQVASKLGTALFQSNTGKKED